MVMQVGSEFARCILTSKSEPQIPPHRNEKRKATCSPPSSTTLSNPDSRIENKRLISPMSNDESPTVATTGMPSSAQHSS